MSWIAVAPENAGSPARSRSAQKAKKGKMERKRTAKKNNPKRRSTRKPGIPVVATSEKGEAEVPQARTPHDI